MKKFTEKQLYEIISKTLRNGVILFMLISFLSYLFKDPQIHKFILDIAIMILISTPIMRIIILVIGFYKLGDKKYSFYSFVILVLLFLGLFIKK
jgi:uncharacterized membrane protein